MTTNSMPNQPVIQTSSQDNEIDLKQVFTALLRRKALIATIAATSFLTTCLYSVTRKPIWEGQFEIVLARAQPTSSQASSLLQSNPGLANLIGVRGDNNQLETEVQILASPSVLKL